MEFVWIDFSDTYYRLIIKKPIPSHRSGKFVQVENGEEEFIVLSPKELSVFHANIVERFCNLNEIKGYYNKQHNIYTISNPYWEVLGGGEWKINETLKQLYLFGKSQAYGQFSMFNLKKKIHLVSGLKGYEIHLSPPPT